MHAKFDKLSCPDGIGSDRFDIVATAEGDGRPSPMMVRRMRVDESAARPSFLRPAA
jgi:hypothetical protein